MSERIISLDIERQKIDLLLEEMELRGNDQLHSKKNEEIFFKCENGWVSSFPGATGSEGDDVGPIFAKYLSIVWQRKSVNKK